MSTLLGIHQFQGAQLWPVSDTCYLEPIKEESNAGSISDLGSSGTASGKPKLTLQALLAQESGGTFV